MEYPLFIGGEKRGILRMTQEGLYTVFEAELPGLQEGIYRISLHGGAEQAYLGILQPWSGGMYLRKKITRSERKKLPQSIEFASDEENCKPGADQNFVAASPACPWPAPVPEESGLLWFRREDGSLVSHDGISSLVALPAALRREQHSAVLRKIEDKEYIVFRY